MASITREVTYSYSVEQVWEAISDKDAISTWLMKTDLEPVVGHQFTFQTDPAPGFDGTVRGEVLEVEPHKRLVYSWNGGTLVDTKVSFDLEPVDGGTRVRFAHTGINGIRTILPRMVLSFGWRSLLNKSLLEWITKKNS